MNPAHLGCARARSSRRFVAAALLAATSGVLVATAPDEARAATPKPVLLVNDWRSWTAVRQPPRSRGVSVTTRNGLRIRLAPTAHPRARGAVRLTLPQGVSPVAIRLRVSFHTPGAVASVSRGTATRRVWSRRPGQRGKQVVLTLPLRSSRTVVIALQRRAPNGTRPRRAAMLTVHAYALSLPGRRVPVPTSSRTPVAGEASASTPVPRAGVVALPTPDAGTVAYSGPRVYWGARIGG
ncbi:MAG TPA: hypothetical protein VNT51_04160, partial [Miltoncostaeaceae bacterium]|nr:hypothetical protein [Miltoncostaeaceae bacterium]